MEGFGSACRCLLVLAVVLGALAFQAPAHASTPGFFVGVDEDSVKWGQAPLVGSLANALGLKAVRLTVQWRPGDTAVSSTQKQVLNKAVIGTLGLRLVVSVYGNAADAPRTDQGRADYCNFVADLARTYPIVSDVVIWNDPNDGAFWSPQYNADGSSAAAADYEALLAQCYPVLHAVRPSMNVIALTATQPADSRVFPGVHTVRTWYQRLAAAYRARGRTTPLFDTVGHIPHPAIASERPWTKHADGTIGQGDYDKLIAALAQAFTGTPQPLPGQGAVSIWYLAQGFQTVPDATKRGAYTGVEMDLSGLPTWSPAAALDTRAGSAPDQATQLADAIRIAYCQPAVGAFFNFQLADENRLEGWQSGVLFADWTPKAAYAALKRTVAEVNARSVDCSTFATSGVPPVPARVAAPGPDLALSDLRVASVSAFSARIQWRTLPASVRIAYGLPQAGPTLWAQARGSETTLPGLSPATTYRVWLSALADDGRRTQTTFAFRTAGLPRSPSATVNRQTSTLLVEGQPFFPFMVWSQCSDQYPYSLSLGINLFAANSCGGFQAQLDELNGRALSAGVAGKSGGRGPGVIGWFHQDEPDGSNLTGAQLPPAPDGIGGVSFLTLTSHFYSGAAPFTWGRGAYPGLIAKADVVGFDLYPLQELCRPEHLVDVFLAQQELVKLATGKPTFQWIEAASWKCPEGRTQVTPAVVEAESWLAIAGGAEGLGFWGNWGPAVGKRIAAITDDVSKLGAALHATPVDADTDKPSVKAGARTLKGAVYVVAVNASWTAAKATVRVPAAGTRVLDVLNEDRQVVAVDGRFVDSFGSLGVHVYVAAPPG